MEKVEEFTVKIYEEDKEFAIDIEFPDGEMIETCASSILECYRVIQDRLDERKRPLLLLKEIEK